MHLFITFPSRISATFSKTPKPEYASNSHAYRVYKKSTRCVMETCDVEFDEFNGSHGEQVDLSDVGNNEDSSQGILVMGIGDLVPIAEVPRDDEVCDGPSIPPPQA